MEKRKQKLETYVAPEVEVVKVKVESGFAGSDPGISDNGIDDMPTQEWK